MKFQQLSSACQENIRVKVNIDRGLVNVCIRFHIVQDCQPGTSKTCVRVFISLLSTTGTGKSWHSNQSRLCKLEAGPTLGSCLNHGSCQWGPMICKSSMIDTGCSRIAQLCAGHLRGPSVAKLRHEPDLLEALRLLGV